jgi:hypothetical protein
MKKILLLATIALLFSVTSQAQQQKGNFLLGIGVGAGYYYAGGLPLMVSGEYCFTDNLSIGGYLGYTTWSHDYARGYDYKYTFIDFGARGSYHFNEVFGITNKKLDVYGGGFLGFVSSSYSGTNNTLYRDSYDGGVRVGIHAGARYYFAPRVAGYGEVGVGYVPLSIGLTFKL